MGYTIEELIEIYAEVAGIDFDEAAEMYNGGIIDKKDLLAAYLENEGFYGYTNTIWHIFNTLK